MPPAVSRRNLLRAAASAAAAGAGLDAFALEPGDVELTRVDLAVPGLAGGLEGLTIAQLTDVHLGAMHRAAERAMELVASEMPDVVVLTGDICDDPGRLGEVEALARGARGRLATVAIAGNWEHWKGIDRARLERAYERAGARLLWNDAAAVERGGARLSLLGLDDPLAGAPSLAAALKSAPSADAQVWLVHGPAWVDEARFSTPPPALVLAGHTHGGQARLPGLPAVVPPGSGRFVAGLYRDTRAPLYVSRGLGTSVVPARFLCRPELPIVALRRA